MSLIVPRGFMTYKILGIDPGLNNTGLAIFDIDYATRSILSIETITLVNEKLLDRNELNPETSMERISKLYRLKNAFKEMLQHISPCIVACESPFYNRFRPSAYSSLIETICYLHTAVIELNPNIIFETIEPLLVKKIVGAGATKGKVDVKHSVISNHVLISALKQNIELLDEHSIDAIAVGYAYLQSRLPVSSN